MKANSIGQGLNFTKTSVSWNELGELRRMANTFFK